MRETKFITPAARPPPPHLQIIVEQELVQLRRRHRRARQHRVHLAAMMDVVHEEMGQDIADAFGDHAVLAPVGDDAAIEIRPSRQAIAEGDQPPVERRLRGAELRRIECG